jgi:uncharacterized protein (TIGR02996 family)
MTHDEAFLQDILDHPEDEAPQLIYADWLEDQGDTGRAEFLRLQAQLARMSADDPSRPALEERERRLFVEQAPGWGGLLCDRAAAVAFGRRALAAGMVPVQLHLDRLALLRLAPCPGLRVDLTGHQTPPDVVEFVPESVAREYLALPLAVDGRRLTLALRDPADRHTIDVLAFIHNREIEAVAAPAGQLAAAVDRHWPAGAREEVITACFLGYSGGPSGPQ